MSPCFKVAYSMNQYHSPLFCFFMVTLFEGGDRQLSNIIISNTSQIIGIFFSLIYSCIIYTYILIYIGNFDRFNELDYSLLTEGINC